MRLLFRYLRSRLGGIALFLAFALVFAAAFALYHLAKNVLEENILVKNIVYIV